MVFGFLGTDVGFIFDKSKQSDTGWDLEPHTLYQAIKLNYNYLINRELEIIITGIYLFYFFYIYK